MADFIAFDEGVQSLLTSGDGLPATAYFLLSTTAVASLAKSNTLAAGVGEITGTGYARQSQATPVPSGEVTSFAQMSWSTGSATNWPSTVASVILATTSANTGHAICAWNLVAGGGLVNMAQANATLNVTPTLTATS
jgi:hypothetical protein